VLVLPDSNELGGRHEIEAGCTPALSLVREPLMKTDGVPLIEVRL
jgi:hypothetical protein